MGPKAKKGYTKRAQEAGEKEVLEEVDKEFYELQLSDLNRKLARLRARCSELEEECDETKKALQKLDEDRADIIAFLKRTLQAKSDEIVELQERLTALQQARETEKEMFIEKIKNMETDFKLMHEQLTSEIKLLNGKLNSLEEFRNQREELMNKFLTQEQAMADQEERHKQTLYEVERKFIIAKDELKKDMESKLLQLSLDFQNATQMRIAATTQRVIRENVAVNNELASLMESWRQLTDEVTTLKEKNKSMKMEIELHKDEKLQCLKRNEIQTRVIDKISSEHEKLLVHYNNLTHFENKSTQLEGQVIQLRNEYEQKEIELQKLAQLLHYSENERNDLQKRLHEVNRENNKLDNVIMSATKAVMDCAILENPESELDETKSAGERTSLLNILLDLFNSVDIKKHDIEFTPVRSAETITGQMICQKIYDLGDLGIICKKGDGN